MNLKLTCALALSAFCLASPLGSWAQSETASSGAPAYQDASVADTEAMQMVPAQAALKEQLDGKKLQSGYMFHAVLANKVRLKNGTELPSGTVLAGKIVEDDMQVAGSSKIALRFTSANLKNGQVVPIKATIIEINRPGALADGDYPVKPGDQVPNDWNARTHRVDQINVISGVDLHSSISSRNSGVLVSNNDKDVKLNAGTELQLAIAARQGDQGAS